MFNKLLNKIIPRRYVRQTDLAFALRDCFTNDKGNYAFESQSFSNGFKLTSDSEGNTQFYPKIYVDAAVDRVNAIVKALSEGEEIESPEPIPQVKLFGKHLRGKTLLSLAHEAVHTGMHPEMMVRVAHQNRLSCDIETATFLIEAVKSKEGISSLDHKLEQCLNKVKKS